MDNKKNIEIDEERPFSTRDLYLASTLVTLRFPLLGIDYQVEGLKPKPIGYFKFEDSPELQEARRRYNQSLLSVEPKLFISNLQSLKAEVVNMFQNPDSTINRDNLS
ncbi:MAG: hypothetical protein NUV96_02175 [Candidatus Colwellbacteria bacterium]|nr:hypothetical protein [Candidatus Colwellbacteria bacterium]